MAKSKGSETQRSKKTFKLVDYEEKYKKEREMNEVLMIDRFGLDRKALGIKTSEQLNIHLQRIKSTRSDHFLSEQNSQPPHQFTQIKTIDDGNGVYHAAALGICDLIGAGLLPESPGSKKLSSLLGNGDKTGVQETLLARIANKSAEERQRLFVPHLRRLALDFVREHYQSMYQEAFEVYLHCEYENYRQSRSWDQKYKHYQNIRAKFDECTKWYEVLEWWNNTGQDEYFQNIRDESCIGFPWETKIVLAALAALFKIRIHFESEPVQSSYGYIDVDKHILLDEGFSPEEKEQLCQLNICDKKFEQYYLKVKTPKEMQEAVEKLSDSVIEHTRRLIEMCNLSQDRDCAQWVRDSNSHLRQLKNRGIVSVCEVREMNFCGNPRWYRIEDNSNFPKLTLELREKLAQFWTKYSVSTITTSMMYNPFSDNELATLQHYHILYLSNTKQRLLLLGSNKDIDQEGIEFRLNGLPALLDRLLVCLKVNSPELKVRQNHAHWEYCTKHKFGMVASVAANMESMALDNIIRSTSISMQKNKIFQGLKYCIRGLRLNEKFFYQDSYPYIKKEWSIIIIILNNLEVEKELLSEVDECCIDYLVIRKKESIEIIAAYVDSWPLKEYLKSIARYIHVNKMGRVDLLGVATLLNDYHLVAEIYYHNFSQKFDGTSMSNALAIAAEYKKEESLRYLEIQAEGINKDSDLKSALGFAVEHKFRNAIRYLVQRGANVESSLVLAARRGYSEVVKYLFENSKSIISRDIIEESIRDTSSIVIIRYLLPYISESENYTSVCEKIFESALLKGILEIVKLFIIELKMNSNLILKNRLYPLIMACDVKNVEIARFLIQFGADPNFSLDTMIDGKMYSRPIIHAFKSDCLPLVKCIIEEAMSQGINLNLDGLTQEQQDSVARIHQEVENERRLQVSVSVLAQSSMLGSRPPGSQAPEERYSKQSESDAKLEHGKK